MNTENPTAVVPAPKNRPWKIALWGILGLAAVLVLITFLSAIITEFTWTKLAGLFEKFWIAYVIILAFVYILLFAFFSSTYKMVVYSFMGLAVVLVIASAKGNWIADKIRGYIDTNFDLNYLLGGIAMFGIILALIPIWQDIKKRVK